MVTKPAPAFTCNAVMPDGSVGPISLSDYKGKYVVLFFYPLDFTFVCPTEIIAFSDAAAKFKELNCEVIGASCDSDFTHTAWINTPKNDGGLGPMNIPLLADFNKKVATDYGVIFDEDGIPARGLFIINEEGVLRHVTINDPPVGRNVDEVLRLVQAYQHTDKHGEVCPAGWTPGADTMIADTQKSKAYFKKKFS
jgi:alkyl hydroperoxide reductase subunit AhpC